MRRRSVLLALALAALATPRAGAEEAPRLNVVATFSILADFARNVGGDRVNVTALVGPDSDTHVYTPTPEDAKRVSEAKLVIVNGLGLEGWLPRLVKSSGDRAIIVTVTKGIIARKLPEGRDHGHAVDPHAWQAVPNARIYVANIRDALIAADPPSAEIYRGNAQAYLAELDKLDREVRAAVDNIPANRRRVISTHDAFGYFADAYGIAFIAPQGVSTEAEVSARDLAAIVRQIKAEAIPAVFLENVTDPRLMRQIASETGARIGGTLYSDSLTGEKGEAPTYIAMVRHNIKALTSALSGQGPPRGR
ncbi:metal ABC transporter substrate-binding protein [Bradyrhizobium sp. 2TAF24]|uniref:metal ABC transporter substrate-binding protein n=1 Tax=Bradyrhizobium sp. 2TAF24 TaxID=3233011 RepID=UPI003F907A81